MKIQLSILLILIVGTVFAQEIKQPKLSATTRQYLWKQKNLYNNSPQILKECVYRQDAAGRIYLASFIKVYPFIQQQKLDALGVIIGSKSKDIWTAFVPLENVESFTQVSGIEYIDIDRPAEIQMDAARLQTHVDSLHQGINLPQAYTGSGVVVGIIDGGFDYTHPAVFDTSYSTFRLKSVWEQKNIGTPPGSFGFGAEYTDSTSIFNKATDNPAFSHGAHVAGIAGGSGYGGPNGNNQIFRGMAYNSDLVFVGINPALNMWLNTGLTDMIDGINYIYDYAASVGKPAVANLSWGNPIGPHDGLALFSQACDNTTGSGRIFVLSAGNNAGRNVHFQKNFSPTDTIIKTFIQFGSGLPSKTNWVDIWADTAQTYCLQFTLYGVFGPVTSSAKFCLDNQTHQIEMIGSNNDTCFITMTSVNNEYNGKAHILLDIYDRSNNKLLMNVIGQGGKLDMWQGYVLESRGYYGAFSKDVYSFAANGDDNMTASDMASTNAAIAVGAYSSKVNYTNVSNSNINTGQTLYNIASFSSKGPTADGRTKPNITGPGSVLASAINAQDAVFSTGGSSYSSVANKFVSPLNGVTYSYAMLQGTSMSSPAVAGIIALLLEANPNLDPYQIQTLLYNTAIKDTYTGAIPSTGSNRWGWGKVNAYAALYEALTITGVYHEDNSPLQGILYPNPSNGQYSIELKSEKDEQVQILLFDVNGRILDQINWSVSSGTNVYQSDWNSLSSGIYIVQLKSELGTLNIKVIKE